MQMNLMSQFNQFMQNPMQYMMQMNIPKEYQNNPQAAIQHLMDTGRINQAQYNQAQQMARQMQRFMK